MFKFFFDILSTRLFGNLSCPFRFRSSLLPGSGPVKFLTRFHACFVPARFSGAFSCPFDLLTILNAFSRFPVCAHAHSFSKSLRFSRPLGLCSLHPLFQSGNFTPMFVPASISIARLFIFVSDILSIIAHLLSFVQFKVAFDALLTGLPKK